MTSVGPDPSTTPSGDAVELRALSKHYGDLVAVDDIDLQVRDGEFLTLLGPSGSGKTTTLSMIAGFTAPSGGQVVVRGTDITATPPHKRNMGMVFQNYSLFPHLDVLANVAFPLRQRGVARATRLARARDALEAVELGARTAAMPNELSGGQQQRVALARALVFEPSLLLMDEPFGALDRGLREKMQLEVRRIHRELSVTVLFVTHDQQEALTMSDRIAVFNRGSIEQIGTPDELYERPASLFVATFVGESTVIAGRAQGETLVTDTGTALPLPAALEGPAALVVRPERVRVHAPDQRPSGSAGVAATVRDVTYLGAHRRVELDTEVGEVVAHIAAGDPAPEPGAHLAISWQVATSAAFPDPDGDEHRDHGSAEVASPSPSEHRSAP
ncbi:MAG: ABC transporter ATP-binding protein [Nitriliruptoraceae bacterium]|nr:ABC transporter ATP-binding protein [Nitriliruptoraceae bacterium]